MSSIARQEHHHFLLTSNSLAKSPLHLAIFSIIVSLSVSLLSCVEDIDLRIALAITEASPSNFQHHHILLTSNSFQGPPYTQSGISLLISNSKMTTPTPAPGPQGATAPVPNGSTIAEADVGGVRDGDDEQQAPPVAAPVAAPAAAVVVLHAPVVAPAAPAAAATYYDPRIWGLGGIMYGVV